MPPLGGRHHVRGVRCVLQDVVSPIGPPAHHLINLSANLNHRLAEAIELRLVLTLGRLDHESAGHRERHRRRVEAVIHQAFRDIHLFDSGALEGPQVEDQLVSDASICPRIQHRIVRFESRLDVVGVEDRIPRRVGCSLRSEHTDVPVRDEQDTCAAPRRSRDSGDALLATGTHERV